MKDASDIVAEVFGKVVDDELARRLKSLILEHVEAVALAGIAAEREECAKIAGHTSAWCRSFSSEEAAEQIAAAIRARGAA